MPEARMAYTPGGWIYDVQPGDGTRYTLVVTPIGTLMAELIPGASDEYALVCVLSPIGRGSYPFRAGAEIGMPDYVNEHLNLQNMWSATVIHAILPLITTGAPAQQVLDIAERVVRELNRIQKERLYERS